MAQLFCQSSLVWFSVVKLTFSFRQTPSWLWLVRTNSPVFTPPGNGPVGTNNGRTPPYYGHASSQRIPRLYHIQVWLTVLWCNAPLKTNRESRLIEFFVFVNFQRTVRFGSLQSFTVRKIGDFPFSCQHWHPIIRSVKMWPGGAPNVVVGTLKIKK